jgi:histidyl-tRNA synthetase
MKFQPPKGTRDFLPEEMLTRQQVLDKIKSVFETFGFQPLETPAIEEWEVLSAKGAGGEEILKETYNFEDKGGRRIGLRYDLTVPLARMIASNPNLPLPFKRYQIQNVWRYGDVTKDRFREFLQADIDTVGSESMLADAEIVACVIACFSSLGFKKFLVRLNNRKILSALVKYAGVEAEKIMDAFRIIDKLAKVGEKGVERELLEKRISDDSIKKILDFIKITGKPEEVLKKAEDVVKDFEEGREGVKELKEIISYLKKMKVEPKFKIDLSLARGLDYYTGPIFEVFAEEGIGSLAGGGRYDKMIGLFLGRDVPATGISFGIERIIEVMKDRNMIRTIKTKVKIYVVAVNDKAREKVLEIVQTLRKNGISSDFDVKGRNITRQLEYADTLGIPYCLIVGPEEVKKNKFKLKDMKKKTERELKLNEIIKFLIR